MLITYLYKLIKFWISGFSIGIKLNLYFQSKKKNLCKNSCFGLHWRTKRFGARGKGDVITEPY
jgi:hypothetical protein